MEKEEGLSGDFLTDPLTISDLIGKGAKFEIKANFDSDIYNNGDDDVQMSSDEEDDEKTPFKESAIVSPWTQTFDELRLQMTQIDEFIYKRITRNGKSELGNCPLGARAVVHYNMYLEGENAPYDSTYLRGKPICFQVGCGEVLEGIDAAVLTMQKGEHAQFVISYKMLFHELGCPPRIKPRADGLVILELISFEIVGDENADELLSAEDRRKFPIVVEAVKKINDKAKDYFKRKLFKNANRSFDKAVQLLRQCTLANEEEQNKQTDFLITLYTNLAVCYIKLDWPTRACIMVNEIRRLTNKPSCKALFQEGRALFMLGEYERSRVILIRARNMEPQNLEIAKLLNTLDERYKRYKHNEKDLWTKAMGIVKEADKPSQVINTDDLDIEEEMRSIMQSIKEDPNVKDYDLPSLTRKEVECFDKLAKEFDMQLNLSPKNGSNYILRKN